MSHFEHGAIDKTTSYLVDPISALRRTIYECPDCKRDVFVRKGEIKIPHFAHRKDKDNSCTYYNSNPSLDQQHKNAQLKLKQFLERGTEIDIGRRCACGCGWITNWGITTIKGNIVKCEHRFKFNDSTKSADVAVLTSNNDMNCIFEIVHKHYTREIDRPEPWHEIRAAEINAIPSDTEKIVLTCVREKVRQQCIDKQKTDHDAKIKRMNEEKRRFHEWVKMEDERMKILLEKESKEAEIQKQLTEKIKKENEENHKKDIEERKKQVEIQKKLEEKIKNEAEILCKKEDKEQERIFKDVSKQISPCMYCSPFYKWNKTGERSWDWCRCEQCIGKIRIIAKSKTMSKIEKTDTSTITTQTLQ